MKVYAVHEYELETLSTMNAIALGGFSVGSALFSLGIGILIDTSIQAGLTPIGELLRAYVGPLLLAFSTAPYAFGIWALWRRKSAIRTIKDGSSTP